MRVEDSKLFLEAVDELLIPDGFVRRSRSREWSKRSNLDRLWVHLSFGKDVLIHPSFGVEYLDLKRRWPNLPGAVYGTMTMLGSCFKPPRQYSAVDGPQNLIADLNEHGLRAVTKLQEREHVVESLQSANTTDWPVPSFSHRIRLAPLLLCAMGCIDEALILAADFATKSDGKDQIVPTYDVFVESLRIGTAV